LKNVSNHKNYTLCHKSELRKRS